MVTWLYEFTSFPYDAVAAFDGSLDRAISLAWRELVLILGHWPVARGLSITFSYYIPLILFHRLGAFSDTLHVQLKSLFAG